MTEQTYEWRTMWPKRGSLPAITTKRAAKWHAKLLRKSGFRDVRIERRPVGEWEEVKP